LALAQATNFAFSHIAVQKHGGPQQRSTSSARHAFSSGEIHMESFPLAQAVFNLGQKTCSLADPDLDLQWDWLGYQEGVRFAFFRTCEQLNDLAASLAFQRCQTAPLTPAQHLLSDYHAAYRDLQAVLLGVGDQRAGQAPAEGEWPVQTALLHVIQAERAFYGVTLYALQRERSGGERPLALRDESWEAMWAGDPFHEIKASGTFNQAMRYYNRLHRRVIDALADIRQEELDAPVVFWESEHLPVRFRLGRFSSHLRQHTIQIEKILAALGQPPNEARRLLRLVCAGLAKVEAALTGQVDLGNADCQSLAAEIDARTAEILQVVAG
jgi:hypothetical protein